MGRDAMYDLENVERERRRSLLEEYADKYDCLMFVPLIPEVL